MKKTRNPNLVKARHSYTFQEIAEVYKVHLRTVQNWRKKGLEILAKGGQIDYVGADNVEFSKVGEVFGSYQEMEIKGGKFVSVRVH